jgi:lipoprotein-anchoring transpeptidase ErfK/SrfK
MDFKRSTRFITGCLLVFIIHFQSIASVYNLPEPDSRLIGEKVEHTVIKGDYFQALAEHYNVGFMALLEANPDIDPFLPPVGSTVIIPKDMLLPFGKREGIVINLSELRLYYFPPKENLVYVFPVGIGREGLSTPHVTSTIGEMRKDPEWRPTKAMRDRYFADHGKVMKKVFPAGPDNPFGKYALRIGTSEYLIHGTNQRFGIGMRASSGCIRMYADDIEWLFNNIKVGTPIKTFEQPIKMSYEKSGKYIEWHTPLSSEKAKKDTAILTDAVKSFVGDDKVALETVVNVMKQPQGLVIKLN